MGSRAGGIKMAAKRLHVSESDYKARRLAGLKHCTKCKCWKPVASFNVDRSRHDGLTAKCRQCQSRQGYPDSMTKSDRIKASFKTFRPNFIPPMKGKRMSAESRQKMSESAKRRGSNRTGKKHTPETRKRISEVGRVRALKGPACHSYKDGLNHVRRGLRETAEYKQWRYDVFFRDGFSCQLCGDNRGGNLNAHHIYHFADHPPLRLNIDNGVTLCEPCHDSLHYKPESIRNKRKTQNLIRTLRLIRRR